MMMDADTPWDPKEDEYLIVMSSPTANTPGVHD